MPWIILLLMFLERCFLPVPTSRGDVLLTINGVHMANCSHEEVTRYLLSVPTRVYVIVCKEVHLGWGLVADGRFPAVHLSPLPFLSLI